VEVNAAPETASEAWDTEPYGFKAISTLAVNALLRKRTKASKKQISDL
jgi:hypothetical protein